MKDDEITWGKKMIKVSLHFWTNNLPSSADLKTAWASGALHLVANEQRGIKPDMIHFHEIGDLIPKLSELLKRDGIKLVKQEKITEVDLSKVYEKK